VGLIFSFICIFSPTIPQAKTAIAPLDRVKILFQTSNPQYEKYVGMDRTLKKPGSQQGGK